MSGGVFTAEYAGEVYAYVRAQKRIAEAQADLADLRVKAVDVLEAGGVALHSLFVAGDFPKGIHEDTRHLLLKLSAALAALDDAITEAARAAA